MQLVRKSQRIQSRDSVTDMEHDNTFIVGKAAPQIINVRNKILPAGTDKIVLPIDLPDGTLWYSSQVYRFGL